MKKLRKILCVALVLLLLVASVPAVPVADLGFGITASALNATGKCGENATYTFDSATGELVISGTGALEYRAFDENQEIKNVIIGDGITEISNSAFYGCEKLTSVDIGDDVIRIGHDAFSWCSRLINVDIGENVTSIGDCAFFWCTDLESVEIGDSVTTIGDKVFWSCVNLTSIYIGENVTSIGDGAFGGCRDLVNVNIPEGITSIGDQAFYSCTSLKSIDIPDSVISIDYAAFRDCTSLKSVIIPGNVIAIDSYAFFGCNGLESINIPKSITYIGEEAFGYSPILTDIYYAGSKEEWNLIDIRENNTALENATIHFGSVSEPSTECAHNTGEHTVIQRVEPTCTEDGHYRYYQCKCGVYFNRFNESNNQLTEVIEDPTTFGVIPNLGGHTWNDGEVTTAAKCEARGIKTFECIVEGCYATKTEEIEALGHDFAYATCKDPKKCTREGCTATEGTPVPHDVEGVEFTKYDDEYHTKKCKACGVDTTYSKHTFGESVLTIQPTCTEKGEMISTCEACGATKTAEVAAVGHRWQNGVCKNCTATCIHEEWTGNVCKNCGFTCVNHQYSDATCQDEGICYICGNKVANKNPNNHVTAETYIKNQKEAKCYEPGYTGDEYYVCCDTLKQVGKTITVYHVYATTLSKKDDATHGKKCTNEGCSAFEAVAEHNYKLNTIIRSATCVENGEAIFKCDDCGAVKVDILDVLDHDTTGVAFEKADYYSHGKRCVNCGEFVEKAAHAYTETISNTLPTCVTEGSETKKCVCGDTKTEVIPANDNHDWGAFTIIKAPTCTEKGEKARICKRVGCTAKDSVEIILATEHTYSQEKIIIKTPTCKSEGTKATVCINCGDIKSGSEEIVPATHNYPDNWSVLVEPDCETKGINVKICLNCNDLITQKLPKAGHADKDGDSKCDTCNKEIIVTEPDEPAEPDTPDEPEVPEEKPCSCDCHAGGIKAFFFKLLNFFAKIFDKSARVCECGKSH